MVASRYDFFKVQSSDWQKKLNTLADMIAMLAELQRMWSYLEPLFIGSDEVRKELPEDAAKFIEIDKAVRENLKGMWSIKNARVPPLVVLLLVRSSPENIRRKGLYVTHLFCVTRCEVREKGTAIT